MQVNVHSLGDEIMNLVQLEERRGKITRVELHRHWRGSHVGHGTRRAVSLSNYDKIVE